MKNLKEYVVLVAAAVVGLGLLAWLSSSSASHGTPLPTVTGEEETGAIADDDDDDDDDEKEKKSDEEEEELDDFHSGAAAARIIEANSVLLILSSSDSGTTSSSGLNKIEDNLDLKSNMLKYNLTPEGFCGTVITVESKSKNNYAASLSQLRASISAKSTVFLCGDMKRLLLLEEEETEKEMCSMLQRAARVFIVRELSVNYSHSAPKLHSPPPPYPSSSSSSSSPCLQRHCGCCWPVVGVGRVPIRVHGVGVYYREYFAAGSASSGSDLNDENDNNGNNDKDYFNAIRAQHAFQALTESTKPGTAHRTGIYLSPVHIVKPAATSTSSAAGAAQKADGGDDDGAEEEIHFNLLRCSSNLSGPTGNFESNDQHIVSTLNEEAACIFDGTAAPLNHVLAQIYQNSPASTSTSTSTEEVIHKKQTKAKIKDHSDKTKDMPRNGIMAFVTFYDKQELKERLSPMTSSTSSSSKSKNGGGGGDAARASIVSETADPFDYGYKGKGATGLTTLYFRLKKCVAERPGCTLTSQFGITLYPNSVFFMPLSTNRLYTHEILPSTLMAQQLPTRMGYVVRCSNTEAVFRKGKTYIKKPKLNAINPGPGANSNSNCNDVKKNVNNSTNEIENQNKNNNYWLVPLEPLTSEGMAKLRQDYAEENRTDDYINYGFVPFSMNGGDYMKPCVDSRKEDFRRFSVHLELEGDTLDRKRRGGGLRLFDELVESVQWESVCKGRQGTVLVDYDSTGSVLSDRQRGVRGVPIVRTTTQYSRPAQCFKPLHRALARAIEKTAGLQATNSSSSSSSCNIGDKQCATPNVDRTTNSRRSVLNNALIEVYNNEYKTMGFHSDQALDLEEDSTIAVFSCYKYPISGLNPPRKLVVESKLGERAPFEIPMTDNSVIVFSTECNKRYRHKIVLDQQQVVAQSNVMKAEENPWLGVTFRTSKTFITFDNTTGTGTAASATGSSADDAASSYSGDSSGGGEGARAFFEDGTPLILVQKGGFKGGGSNQGQGQGQGQEGLVKHFYTLRSQENKEVDFSYPAGINYTISESDLLPPTTAV